MFNLEKKMGNHLTQTCQIELDTLVFQLRELFCHSGETSVHSLIFCLTSPLFDPDKKGAREPPGGFFWE